MIAESREIGDVRVCPLSVVGLGHVCDTARIPEIDHEHATPTRNGLNGKSQDARTPRCGVMSRVLVCDLR